MELILGGVPTLIQTKFFKKKLEKRTQENLPAVRSINMWTYFWFFFFPLSNGLLGMGKGERKLRGWKECLLIINPCYFSFYCPSPFFLPIKLLLKGGGGGKGIVLWSSSSGVFESTLIQQSFH